MIPTIVGGFGSDWGSSFQAIGMGQGNGNLAGDGQGVAGGASLGPFGGFSLGAGTGFGLGWFLWFGFINIIF